MQDEISPEAIASAELTSTIEAKDILIDVSYAWNYFSYAVIESS